MDFVASQFEAKSEPLPRQDNVSAACVGAGSMVDVEGPSAERRAAKPRPRLIGAADPLELPFEPPARERLTE